METERIRDVALERCRLAPDRPVLVGVSGGPDSLCLLHALAQAGFVVIAAHFDHALRDESPAEARAVAQMAAQMGVAFVSERGDTAQFAQAERCSLEAAARTLRYRFLFAQARRLNAQAVAVGHTADDQVETLLMHLLRGAGLNGLLGMPARALPNSWDAGIPLVRPLLGLWRSETLAYCQQAGLTPLFDPSNTDPAFTRNRIRGELIPYLETFNPQVRSALLRTADLLAGDAAVIEEALENAWRRCRARTEPGAVGLWHEALLAEGPGLQRALLRRAASALLPGLHNLDARAVERGLEWAARGAPGQVDLIQGLRVMVEAGWVWVARADALPGVFRLPVMEPAEAHIPIPGVLDLPGGWRLECAWQTLENPLEWVRQSHGPWQAWLDGQALEALNHGLEPASLVVRRVAAGDRFAPLGMGGQTVKLSDFWINARLPAPARARWPLVQLGGAIVWVPGFRPAHPARVTDATRRALALRLLHHGVLPEISL